MDKKRRYFALMCDDAYVEIRHTDDGNELTTWDFENGEVMYKLQCGDSVHEISIKTLKLINICGD